MREPTLRIRRTPTNLPYSTQLVSMMLKVYKFFHWVLSGIYKPVVTEENVFQNRRKSRLEAQSAFSETSRLKFIEQNS